MYVKAQNNKFNNYVNIHKLHNTKYTSNMLNKIFLKHISKIVYVLVYLQAVHFH